MASLAAVLLVAGGCVSTRPFLDARGGVVPTSIATMEVVRIGGVEQSLWFRAIDRTSPPVVLLHGGPGASESALFRHFDGELERHFLMVYWEQRGTGRSFHSDIPAESMTVDRMVEDLDEVVELVRRRFGAQRVILLGHSWGTVLGTIYAARHPEKVAAYVGVAQIADMAEGARLSYEFALGEARKRGERHAVAAIERIGPTIRSVDDRLALGGWVEGYGGVFHAPLSTGALIGAALCTDEASLWDLVLFGRGNRFSLERLERESESLDLVSRYRAFRVPIFFLLGRYDHQVPAELAERYFDAIEAPCKRLVWFEDSAHNPPFEEPAKFVAVMTRDVLPRAGTTIPRACAPGASP